MIFDWYWLVVASAILMTIATLVEKAALKAEHATQFSAAFSWIIAIVSLAFLPWASFDISSFQWLLLIVGSILWSANYLITARIYKHGSVSIATSVSSAVPLMIIVILAYFFLSEYLSTIQYLAIIGIIAATYLALFRKGKSMLADFDKDKYRYLMVVNSVLAAVSTIIGKYQLVNINIFAYLLITQLLMAGEFAIFISAKYGGLKEIGQTARKYAVPLVAVVALTIGYRLTYYSALAQIAVPISIAAPLRSTIFTVLTVVAGGMLFREQGMKWKIMLSVVMVALAFILTM
ncbi:MAG: EamA family transporter [Candidatus Micrarchaeota archaeon]|nr:EamA family transporter [Candidatus Micrarchaeota archaeon]